MDWTAQIAALLSGGLVGASLGLIGGGGSILAVPLMVYVIGLRDPHVAIGTSAFAVAINAWVNLAQHWRAGTVKWPCALTFGAAGVIGAAGGSTLGKLVDGDKLLFMFALVMIGVAFAMLRQRPSDESVDVHITPRIALRLAVVGFGAGAISGFFGIGGGFLIVPGIMLGSGMSILNAIGSSLFSVGAFGTTTAVNYALSGLIDWRVAVEFIIGGTIGGFAGMQAALRLAPKKQMLSYLFSGILLTVAFYMATRSGLALLG